jgi:hypothetical protein
MQMAHAMAREGAECGAMIHAVSTRRKISLQIFPPYFPGVNILKTLTYRCAVRYTELVEQVTLALSFVDTG